MSGTPKGAKQAMATIKTLYGVDEEGKSRAHIRAGRKGGQVTGIAKGFALMTLAQRRAVGKKGGLIGGKISRRVYK